jgi:hypothetical protein
METYLGFLVVANRLCDWYDLAPRSSAQRAREEQAFYERFGRSRSERWNGALKSIAPLAAVLVAVAGAAAYAAH